MKILVSLVILPVAAATLFGAFSASAQSPAKPPASSISRPPTPPPVSKSCQAIYDPAPGAPFMHFNVTAMCAALPSSPIGITCGCPVYINGRPATAKGKVIANTSGSAPVVH